ncbi:MAG: hypothetical protein F4X64_17005 [Chloroflexi bacterium]|nr:hypothetical protein [Chloroflexota bacterium]
MTTEQATAAQIADILVAISASRIDEDLVRIGDLGRELNFSEHRGLFEDLLQFTSQLSALAWDKLPARPQRDILNSLNSLDSAVQAVKEFSAATQGEGDRDNNANQLQGALDSFKQVVVPYVGYLSWDSIDLDEYQRSLNENIRQGRETIDRVAREVEATKQSAEDALSTIRAAAAEAGVSQEAATFQAAARRYTVQARWWLGGSVVGVAGTIGAAFGLILLWEVSGKINEADVLQIVLAKAAMLAVLSYATINAVRLYRSNIHLAAVNRHREDALRTFQAFVDGTGSDEIKDKVLLAATHAAFGQTATGLIGDRGDSSNSLEVFDGIAGGLIRRP